MSGTNQWWAKPAPRVPSGPERVLWWVVSFPLCFVIGLFTFWIWLFAPGEEYQR